ncbi:MAG: SIR2 family protein, partial [Bacteroidales bacterium]
LIIKSEILDYSHHSSGRSHIFNNPEKDEINKYFIIWIGELEKRSILRNYSLNYEPIQKFLIESAGIEVFEGFVEPRKEQTDRIRPDISRIQSDIDCNIFYNLHGSVYWQVDYYNPNSLTPPEIRLSLFPSLIDADSQSPDLQLNRGEELRIRNIITGYQKAVKTFVPPFRQMHASFDRDCIMADEIYIIGYSFGDENINQSLKSAIRYNPNVKFIIVDPGFQSNNIDNFLLFNFSPIIYNQASQTPTPKSIQGKLMQYSLFDDRMIAYACRFKEYLESANTSGNSNN